MSFYKKIFAAIFLLAIFGIRQALGFDIPQNPTGYVNDFANLYSASFKTQLEQNLSDFDKKTTNQIAVVTIPSLDGETIENEATQIFDKWKIGKKGKDNGLLLLISKADKKVRIEVGYGLEPVITDGRSGRIIREQISPAFKAENYEAGTWAAIQQLEGYISQDQPPGTLENVHNSIKDTFWPITQVIAELLFRSGFIIFIFPLLAYLAAFLGRSKSIWAGGFIGGGVGFLLGLVIGTILALILSTLFLTGLGLLLDFLLSRNYQQRLKSGHPTDFFSSGGGFFGGRGFGGGGGGFGGFGGGGSGGGGASEDW